MENKQALKEYLKGALAGRQVDRAVTAADSFGPRGEETDSVLQVMVPPSIATGTRGEICVKVRNYLNRQSKGTLNLQGEDQVRGATYDFQADFQIEADDESTMVMFVWRAPRYQTEIKWSVTVSYQNQMGLGLPVCSGSTQVVIPPH